MLLISVMLCKQGYVLSTDMMGAKLQGKYTNLISVTDLCDGCLVKVTPKRKNPSP